MTKRSNTGLATHIWSTFIGLIFVIFLSLFLIQTLFYSQFYGFLKKQELVNQVETINLIMYGNNYEAELDTLSFNENLNIAIFFEENEELDIIYNPTNIITLSQAYSIITSSGKTYEQYNEETENEDGLIVCISYFEFKGDICYVYINTPMTGSAINRSITQYQIIISAIITMILGIVVAYFLSSYLAKPIKDINDAAFLLSNGDYTVTFPEDGYDEIMQLGDSLNKAKDELMKTDILQKEFIANVSHDLRTPLTLIQSYAEMIRDISGENKEKREAHLEVIISEVNRLSSLVTDVLEMTKINANTKQLDIKEVNLCNLITTVLDQVKLPITQNNIKLTTKMEDVKVLVDESTFKQVIYNFILNAITYTKSEIYVLLEIIDDNIIFSVVDNGDGIKEEDINQIWDRYYRSQENHERHKHGSGLGLSIVKSILEAHKLEYGAESEYGHGARFYVKFPYIKNN